MKKENKVSASEMLKNELGLTKAESLFCDLYINGGREFAGQHCKCYREAFQDSGSGVSLKSRRLLGKPHISERIKKLSEQQQTDTEAIAVKLQVTETLKAVMEETSTAKYKDKWGMDLSPAPLRAVAVNAAKARHVDVLLCDTAGRLHNKKNLMEELKKINRILEKEYPDAFRETLVVLDATTGQNALAQAREFADVADITGIILTKMDGTAKGGIAVAIHSELGIPVKYIGVGETIEDLQKFDSNQFVNALFDVQEDKSSPRP